MDQEINFNIVEQCMGCDHITGADRDLCEVWISPNAKWALGRCPTAVNLQADEVEEVAEKKKINPLKASKMKARGR